MPIKTLDLEVLGSRGSNIHEVIVAASKRARQINDDIKIEFNQRVELFATKTEVDSEENDINPDQLKVSLEFEKRPKPTQAAIDELMDGDLSWRYKEREEVPKVASDE